MWRFLAAVFGTGAARTVQRRDDYRIGSYLGGNGEAHTLRDSSQVEYFGPDALDRHDDFPEWGK